MIEIDEIWGAPICGWPKSGLTGMRPILTVQAPPTRSQKLPYIHVGIRHAGAIGIGTFLPFPAWSLRVGFWQQPTFARSPALRRGKSKAGLKRYDRFRLR
jgi:hypothetical protein